MSVAMTLNDLEKNGTRRVHFFWRISVITLFSFDLEQPNLARKHAGGACF